MATQRELRQRVTNQIVEALKQGTQPWRQPWGAPGASAGLPSNAATKKPYRGINVLLLSLAAYRHGWRCGLWGTVKQWQRLGGRIKARPDHVSPEEWGARVVFSAPISNSRVRKDDGKEEVFFVTREFEVFNSEQVDGLALGNASPCVSAPVIDYEPAEQVIRATGANIRYGGNRAYYDRPGDYIQLPPKASFSDAREWYPTHFHELAHWAYQPRLGFKATYAFEELVAEIAACFLATELHVPQSECLDNHHAYLGIWLKELESDHNGIFKASRQASKTADFILSFSRSALAPNKIVSVSP